MKRGGPLKRKTPMKSGGFLKPGKPLKQGGPLKSTATLKRSGPIKSKPGAKKLRAKPKRAAAWEAERLGAVKSCPCIACLFNVGVRTPQAAAQFPGPTQAHHLIDGGRRGHRFTVPLCRWHHQGQPEDMDMAISAAEAAFGPTVATNSRAFHERYGSDDSLLSFADSLLQIKYGRRFDGPGNTETRGPGDKTVGDDLPEVAGHADVQEP